MTAVRLARGATGRADDREVRGLLPRSRRRAARRRGLAESRHSDFRDRPACTAGAVADTIVVPYNDLDALDAALAARRDDLAAIIVEPVAANMGLGPPAARFPRRSARPLRPRRRAAGLRRGDHRLPRRATAARRSCSGSRPTCRSSARWSAVASARCARRPGELMDHLAPLGARVPGGHAVGKPARHRGRARHLGATRRGRLHAPRRHGECARTAPRRRALPIAQRHQSRHARRFVLRRRAGDRLRVGAAR